MTERYQQLKIAMEKERKDLMNKITLLTVNNNKLKEKLDKLKEETDVSKMALNIQVLQEELVRTQRALKKEIEEKSNNCFKLYTLLDVAKKEINENNSRMEAKEANYIELSRSHRKSMEELIIYKEKIRFNFENMAMLGEDNLQYQLRLNAKSYEVVNTDELLKEAQDKINELEAQLKLQREGLIQKKEISMESALFYFVSDNPSGKVNNLNREKSLNGREDYLSLIDKSRDEKKENEKKTLTKEDRAEKIDLKKYCYNRPTYRALIGTLLPMEENRLVSYSPSFPVWLQVNIRAIFDAKFNEYLLSYGKGRRMSRFPDFVYGWLGTFCIDKDTRNVKLLEYTERDVMAAEGRVNILLGLEASSATKLWEVHLFKDFLEETFSLDELAFFLHCRFLMFKGPQLAVATAGFCVTHFITKERVDDTIDRVLYKARPAEIKELKNKLLEFNKTTYKNTNAFDYAMVLRILLEFYRKERKDNFIKFEDLFNSAKRINQLAKPSITFESFYKIVTADYDRLITDQEVVGLYREAFIGGGCSVNTDSVLLTFTET